MKVFVFPNICSSLSKAVAARVFLMCFWIQKPIIYHLHHYNLRSQSSQLFFLLLTTVYIEMLMFECNILSACFQKHQGDDDHDDKCCPVPLPCTDVCQSSPCTSPSEAAPVAPPTGKGPPLPGMLINILPSLEETRPVGLIVQCKLVR